MKDRFRQFWMSSVSDAFKEDLEDIRKVLFRFRFVSFFHDLSFPSLSLLQWGLINSCFFERQEHDFGTTRLGLLIDALASGAEVFKPGGEMEVVLE